MKIILQILKLIKEFFKMKFPNEMLQEAKDKVICEYKLIDDLHKKAEGILYFNGLSVKFISGMFGKGYAPLGEYRAYKVFMEDRDAFKQFSFGWQVPIEAKFKTDRTGLAVHPDGNSPGTLGCIGCDFQTKDANVRMYNKFRDYFDRENILEIIIKKQVSND